MKKHTYPFESLGSHEFLKSLVSKGKGFGLAGWKDDKEQFKIDLVNDIKDFLFTKWEKPWTPSLLFDANGKLISGFRNISGRFYKHQSNIIGLDANKGESPYFITLSKLAELGGSITDSTKKTTIISFAPIYKDKEKGKDGGGTPAPDTSGKSRKPDYMMPLFHQVINVDFTSGIKKPAYNITEFEKLELNQYVENFIEELKKRQRIPKLIYDQADSCYYVSSPVDVTLDEIHLVNIHAFKDIENYYSTLFHEITHSTKHVSRMGVRYKKSQKKLEYANEELVAEMGAMIVCTELGLQYERQNSLSYLKGWLERAVNSNQNIDDVLVEAYTFASEAAEFLLKDIELEKLVPDTMLDRAENETTDIEKDYIELYDDGKVRIINHLYDKRVKIFFPKKPDNSVIETLKRHKFAWAHTAKAWQKNNTPENIQFALQMFRTQPDQATRLRIAKARAAAKLKLLNLI
jgi:antirestriction protein ArdC